MTLNRIETIKTTLYGPQNTKNTKIYDHFFKKITKHGKFIFFKSVLRLLKALFILLRATQPN